MKRENLDLIWVVVPIKIEISWTTGDKITTGH